MTNSCVLYGVRDETSWKRIDFKYLGSPFMTMVKIKSLLRWFQFFYFIIERVLVYRSFGWKGWCWYSSKWFTKFFLWKESVYTSPRESPKQTTWFWYPTRYGKLLRFPPAISPLTQSRVVYVTSNRWIWWLMMYPYLRPYNSSWIRMYSRGPYKYLGYPRQKIYMKWVSSFSF